jgi:ABC-2 type transport system permease protein
MNTWRTLIRLGFNDVRLTARDRAAFFWILILPVGMMWLFGQMGGGQPQGQRKASLLLEDHDGGFFAQALRRELEAEADQIELEYRLAEDSGAAPPADAAAPPKVPTRRLILPAGLSEGLLKHQRQELRLEVSQQASRELNQNLDAILRRMLVRSVGRTVILEVEGKPAEKAEIELRFAEIAARPPLVELKTETVGRAKTAPRGYAQSVPGILTMVVMMMTLIYGGVFLVLEKEQGLLKRQLTLPVSRGQLIAAKILGRLFIAGLQIAILITVGRFFFGLDLGDSKIGLVILLASFALAAAGLSIWIGALSRTREQASTLGWLSSMLMAALGGCWWPAEIMPEWLRQVALVLPTSWAMNGFHQLISYGNGAAAILLPSLVLAGFGATFGALGVRALRAA